MKKSDVLNDAINELERILKRDLQGSHSARPAVWNVLVDVYDAASRDSQSAVPSEEEIEKLGDEYVAGFADEYKALAKINFINGFKRKRGIA